MRSTFKNKAQPLGDVLKEVIDRLGIRQEIDAAQAIEAWATIAGPQINGVTDTVWVRGGKLFVQVSSATWRQELHLQRRTWLNRLNDQLGSRIVQEIVFR